MRICFTPQSDQPGNVDQSLFLDFACLVVLSGNVRSELAVCWNHVASCVCLQRANGHVLDEASVSRCNDEDVVPLVCGRLFRRHHLHSRLLPLRPWNDHWQHHQSPSSQLLTTLVLDLSDRLRDAFESHLVRSSCSGQLGHRASVRCCFSPTLQVRPV